MKVSKIDTGIFLGVMVKIYFDESGNSGCVIPNKKDEFYSDGQRFFVLCGIIVKRHLKFVSKCGIITIERRNI